MSTAPTEGNLIGGDTFEIKEAYGAGRGVFATRDLPAQTVVLETDLIPAWVINKEYKKEVCFNCFTYERGRTLKARDSKTGHYFCSSNCQIEWRSTAPAIAIDAWECMHKFLGTKVKGSKAGLQNGHQDHVPASAIIRPDAEDVKEAWNAISSTAHFIREARNGSAAKPHRRAVAAALAISPSPDQMTLLISGCLTHHNDPKSWEAMMDLTPDESPYTSKADLDSHINSYLQMLAICPVELLPSITAQNCLEIPTRDSHNSFGIRSLDDNGAEFFGFAIWPYASYFNHSCDPLLNKRRSGRQWSFWLDREVKRGDELFISYLGGDEKELDVTERRRRTNGTWNFECACTLCCKEAVET